MEAAIVAATRGHKVTLCERKPRLGGALVVGAILSQELEDLAQISRYSNKKPSYQYKVINGSNTRVDCRD